MLVTTYTSFRRKLKSYLNTVRENHTPLVVTSVAGEDIVVISKSDYESMENVLDQFGKGLPKTLFTSIPSNM